MLDPVEVAIRSRAFRFEIDAYCCTGRSRGIGDKTQKKRAFWVSEHVEKLTFDNIFESRKFCEAERCERPEKNKVAEAQDDRSDTPRGARTRLAQWVWKLIEFGS